MRTKSAEVIRSGQGEALVTRLMTLSASTLNEAERTVQATLVTEQLVRDYDFVNRKFIWEIFRVDGMEPVGQVPLLNNHNRSDVDDVLGDVSAIRLEGEVLAGQLAFDEDEPKAMRAFGKIKRKRITDVSAGMLPLQWEDVPAGATRTINGKQYTAPREFAIRIVTRWALREVSIVVFGADSGAKIRAELNKQRSGGSEGETMKELLKKYLVSRGLRSDADEATAQAFYEGLGGVCRALADRLNGGEEVAEADWAELSAERSAKGKAPKKRGKDAAAAVERAEDEPIVEPVDVAAAVQRALQESETLDRERVRQIRELGAKYGIAAEVVTRCVDEKLGVDAARGAFLEDISTRRNEQTIHGGVHVPPQAREATERQLEDALLVRSGVALDCKDEKDRDQRMTLAERFRGMSVLEVAVACMRMAGVSVPHNKTDLVVRAISTHSFSALLGNIQNKALGTAFKEAPSTARRWCGRKQMNDFKVHREVRVSNTDVFAEISNAGTIPYGEIKDTYEDIKLKTFGQRMSFTREQMIDDDLGALLDTPRKIAMSANRLIDNLVYALMLANTVTFNEDGVVLFHASHKAGGAAGPTVANYFTGATTVLGQEGLRKGKEVMRKIKGMNGESLSLTPKYLIVPPELEYEAERLLMSPLLITGSDVQVGSTNVHARNPLEIVVEDRLSNTGFHANATATQWYLATDPNVEEHIKLGFLNGVETPQIQRTNLDDPLAMHWVAIFDVIADAMGWRGIVKSKGAA